MFLLLVVSAKGENEAEKGLWSVRGEVDILYEEVGKGLTEIEIL